MSIKFSPLYLREVKLSYDLPSDEYYADLPVIRYIKENDGLELTKPITIFVGENGIGKSTLIEALAVSVGLNPEGGSLNFDFMTASSHSSLWKYVKLTRGIRRNTDGFFLRAESFYNAISYLEKMQEWDRSHNPFEPYGGVNLHKCSHGEGFLALVENRFSKDGLYILDEPEAALSPMKLLRLMISIYNLAKGGAQFIISTHSPMLMSLPGADVIQIMDEGLEHIPYQETEHFKVLSDFMDNPDRMLKILLE